jgi:hypothetical protein
MCIKLGMIGDLITVIVGIPYDHSIRSMKTLDIGMAVSYRKLDNTSVGFHLPFKSSEFDFALKHL